MNSDDRKYLLPFDDGLTMRDSQPYARDKLYVLQAYLMTARNAMKKKGWYCFNYIDLQSGPGKNRINGDIILGSPLIALDIRPKIDNFWFNEWPSVEYQALEERLSVSPLRSKISLSSYDVNLAVDYIVSDIRKMDKQAYLEGKWPTLNVAFLDPEGLEMKWSTVEKLASMRRMDLIINFSTSGIRRNAHQPHIVDEFFGTPDWRSIVQKGDSVQSRRELINLYRKQLEGHKYHIRTSEDDEDLEYHDISVKNSRNAEVYSLIFASKHPLGDDLWLKIKKQLDLIRNRTRPLL